MHRGTSVYIKIRVCHLKGFCTVCTGSDSGGYEPLPVHHVGRVRSAAITTPSPASAPATTPSKLVLPMETILCWRLVMMVTTVLPAQAIDPNSVMLDNEVWV